jgi:hypothetical protein
MVLSPDNIHGSSTLGTARTSLSCPRKCTKKLWFVKAILVINRSILRNSNN